MWNPKKAAVHSLKQIYLKLAELSLDHKIIELLREEKSSEIMEWLMTTMPKLMLIKP